MQRDAIYMDPAVYDPAVYDPAVYDPAVYNPAAYDPAVYEATAATNMAHRQAYWQYAYLAQHEYPAAFLPLPPKESPPPERKTCYDSYDSQVAVAADNLASLHKALFAWENPVKEHVPTSVLITLARDAWDIFAIKSQCCIQDSPDGCCKIQKERIGSHYMASPVSDDLNRSDSESNTSTWEEYPKYAGLRTLAPAMSCRPSHSLYETALRQSNVPVQTPPTTPEDAIPPYYQSAWNRRPAPIETRSFHEPCFPNYSDHALFQQGYARTFAHLDLGLEDLLLASYLMTRLSLRAYHELVRLVHASMVPRSSTLFAIATVFALISNKTLQDSAYRNHVVADIARIPCRLITAMERVVLCDFDHDMCPSEGNWMLWCNAIEARLWRCSELPRLMRSVRVRRR